jgi:protein-ribulosamine 3-kinase
MEFNDHLKKRIEDLLFIKYSKPVKISEHSSVSGGSINDAFKFKANDINYFVKVNDALKYPLMFEKESFGLKLLSQNSDFKIPEMILCDSENEKAFLVLEYISTGTKTNSYFQLFGKCLSALHKKSNEQFGLDQDNYIGSLLQSNSFHRNWIEFFITERLSKQLQLALDKRAIDAAFLRKFEKIFKRLNELIPVEPPALLHGDLWNGNAIAADGGFPCLIDPAVYYGHREMDIAMTKLFGGFDPEFYESYNDEFPMEKGWQKRMEIHNLYPLLVHVNLFGEGYVSDVNAIIDRLT